MTQNTLPKQAAVAVIVNADRLLTIKRSMNVRAPGEYCFPGGGIEPGESVEEALVREMREELNILVEPLASVWKSVSPSGVELFWYRAQIAKGETIEPNSKEVESYHWMKAEEIKKLPNLLASNAAFFEAFENGEFQLDLRSL